MATRSQLRGVACGLLAAALFGASAPVAKRLLAHTGPVLLAGLLYLGGAFGLLLFDGGRQTFRRGGQRNEAPFQRADGLPLLGVILVGGMAGPALLFAGLARVSGVAGSLLLNLEAPFTMLLAVWVFGEHLSRREVLAAIVLLVGAACLGGDPETTRLDALGVFLLVGACACWALDNNLTQRLSLRDPVRLAQVKTLAAGAGNVLLGVWLREPFPPWRWLTIMMLVGAGSYGASLVFDNLALRLLGAAREAAVFATAPFLGALLALPLLGEHLGRTHLLAAGTMSLGVVLLLRARHYHWHRHEPLDHEHVHVHDEHHRHEHPPGTDLRTPHSHGHRHELLEHDHPHVSDAHHRHKHGSWGRTPRC